METRAELQESGSLPCRNLTPTANANGKHFANGSSDEEHV